MQKALNYFRGNIRVEVHCQYPERFVNVCAQNGVEFWALQRTSGNSVLVTMHIAGYKKLISVSKTGGFTMKPVKKTGVPFFLWHLRKRYALLAGMLVCIIGVWTLSLFIWEIDVTGNETVPSAEILQALEEMGIGIGSFGPSVANEQISNEILQKITELSWITVNVSGSHANVLVRERIQAPEIVDEDIPTMIYAQKSGIIYKMSVYEGVRVCQVGDTVLAGDIIISGIADSLSSGTRLVHAMADVYARTWYEMSVQMPLSMSEKNYTGRTRTKTAIIFAGKRINIYFNSGILWSDYDKITVENNIVLPTGNVLPITIVRETYSEYERTASAMDEEAAEELLKERLLTQLEKSLSQGEITGTLFSTSVQDGVITVTLKAECIELISGMRELTDEELLIGMSKDIDETEN